MKWQLTAHALQRYRERINPAATVQDMLTMLVEAVPAPGWVKHYVGYQADEASYWISGGAVFVASAEARVLTVLSFAALEHKRGRFTKTERKKRFKRMQSKRQRARD